MVCSLSARSYNNNLFFNTYTVTTYTFCIANEFHQIWMRVFFFFHVRCVFSGSLLIQQISGNSGPPPLINQVNNSVVIAESAATQSVINSQSQYPPSNTSYLINTQQISSENSTIIDQVQPAPCLIPASAPQPNFNQFPAVSLDDGLRQSMKSSTVVQMSSSSVAPVKRVDAEAKATGANRTVDEVGESWPASSVLGFLRVNLFMGNLWRKFRGALILQRFTGIKVCPVLKV